MRVILAAAAALAATTVSGCDINTGPAKTAKVECHCTAPAAPPVGMRGAGAYEPPAEPYRGWHRGRHVIAAGHGHSYYWRREYAELSVITYSYHSDSHSYSSEGGGHVEGGYEGTDGFHAAGGGWIDGYGRAHGGRATTGAPAHFESHGDARDGRADPWHGYDVDCPDPAQHH